MTKRCGCCSAAGMETIVPDLTRRQLTFLGLCAALLPGLLRPTPAGAGQTALRPPEGEILLRVRGVAPHLQNQRDAAAFDLEMLQDLGVSSFTTKSPWASAAQTFRGTPLVALLQRLGIHDGELVARASNDFIATIPVSDAVPDGPLIAWEVDDKRLTLRNRGPLWLIYPFDSDPRWKFERIYSSSVWQLRSLEWRGRPAPPAPKGR